MAEAPAKRMGVCSPSLDSPPEERGAFIKVIDQYMGDQDEVRDEAATPAEETTDQVEGAETEEEAEEEDEEEEEDEVI